MKKRVFALLLGCLLSQASFASLRDPTHPDNVQGTPNSERLSSWGLQAIIISHKHRMAVFDGQVLRLGSKLAGFKVVAIQPNTVHLEGPDGKMTLFLFNQTIKHRVKDGSEGRWY